MKEKQIFSNFDINPASDKLNSGFAASQNDVAINVEASTPLQGSYENDINAVAIDPFALPELVPEIEGKQWKEMSAKERIRTICNLTFRMLALLVLLYVFICSLGIMSDSFRLLGGRTAGEVFQNSELLANPVVGLVIGVLATVLLQSSSTSTSILVSMVASDIVSVRTGIPIVMGANIGTSVTNTLVSVAHADQRAAFRRAFAGATVHDMFNLLSVLILLPLEVISGYLFHLTSAIVKSMNLSGRHKKPPKMLQVLTEPLTKRIIQLDDSVIEKIAKKQISGNDDISLIKRCGLYAANVTSATNGTENFDSFNQTDSMPSKTSCYHLFANSTMTDKTIGIILLLFSLFALILCLLLIVKLLHSMLKGHIAHAVRGFVNAELPGCFSHLTGYLAIAIGAILTILVQSSSVFTSALTPLVGVGILRLERMYPLTLGANVGTTFTSILAALASPARTLPSSLQMALCHLFFNISGILLFYPVPCMRRIPISLAKILGNTTAKYRWFVILYVALMFVLAPMAIFGLSMAGSVVFLGIGIPIAVLIAVVVIVNVMQAKCPRALPPFLRTWNFLPAALHSLRPWDNMIQSGMDALGRVCPCMANAWCRRGLGPDASYVSTSAVPEMVNGAIKNSESRKHLLSSRDTSRSASPRPQIRTAEQQQRIDRKPLQTNL